MLFPRVPNPSTGDFALLTMLPLMKIVSFFSAFLLLAAVVRAQGPAGYYRYPAVHGETVIFTAEGDLWRVPLKGGVAQRLTTHPGSETKASISPDGKWIAFSGEYEGPAELYVMPFEGGKPRRLTWETSAPAFTGWTPDGRVLFSTRLLSGLPDYQLVSIAPDGADMSERLC